VEVAVAVEVAFLTTDGRITSLTTTTQVGAVAVAVLDSDQEVQVQIQAPLNSLTRTVSTLVPLEVVATGSTEVQAVLEQATRGTEAEVAI
jgi:hypothetical protein